MKWRYLNGMWVAALKRRHRAVISFDRMTESREPWSWELRKGPIADDVAVATGTTATLTSARAQVGYAAANARVA